MAQQWFRFKRFSIEQAGAVHSVGSDGVLLGCWASIQPSDRHILDVGTGTGLVALMLAQRSENQPVEKIIGVETHAETAQLARQNFADSAWQHRLEVVHSSFQDFASKTGIRFDLVVSNPPFFSENTHSPDPVRHLGRHIEHLPPRDLIRGVLRVLAPQGRFCVILPPKIAQEYCEIAAVSGLYFSRIVKISTAGDKSFFRWMLEFCRSPQFIALEVWDLSQPTCAFHRLSADFYVNTD